MFGTGKISSSRSKECKRLPSSSSVANSSLELNWKGFLRSSTSSINIIVWCTICCIRITHLILMPLLIVVVWCCLLQFKVNLFEAEFFFRLINTSEIAYFPCLWLELYLQNVSSHSGKRLKTVYNLLIRVKHLHRSKLVKCYFWSCTKWFMTLQQSITNTF